MEQTHNAIKTSGLPAFSPVPGVLIFTEGERRVFRRKERLSTSEWAARHRVVTNGPITGKWRNETTPYLVEPMDTLDLPYVRRVILMFAPQTGKTQVAFNFLGHMIDADPGPAMYVMPDEKVCKRIARKRIIPMFRSSPRLSALLTSRPDDTTTLAVSFINGMDFMMAWATSAAEISSEPVKYLIRDEIDKFPDFSGKEADPLSLTEIRTNAYPHTKKILDLSTPADESGYIGKAIELDADEIRHYHAICPICAAAQVMHFGQFTWPEAVRDPREIIRKRLAHYQCSACGMFWDDYIRDQAVQKGFWRPETPVDRPQCVAFHLPAWYSPFISLSTVVAAHLRSLEDPGKLMVFITQIKAEVWKESITPKDEQKLLDTHRTELPPLIVPAGAVALTCGIDVQKFGFWFVVRAWAEDLTSWLVQYGFISDFTAVEDLIFHTAYPVQDIDKTMNIWRVAMDTGGGATDDADWTRTEEIYEWIRAVNAKFRTGPGPDRVYGTKGSSRPIAGGTQRIKVSVMEKFPHSNRPIPGSLELRLLDSAQFKALIHWRMERGLDEASGGSDASQRFLLHAETGTDYALQLLSEELVRDRRGKRYWKRIRKENHLLDAEILAAAAADNQWLPSLKMLAAWIKRNQSTDATTPIKKRPVQPKNEIKRW